MVCPEIGDFGYHAICCIAGRFPAWFGFASDQYFEQGFDDLCIVARLSPWPVDFYFPQRRVCCDW